MCCGQMSMTLPKHVCGLLIDIDGTVTEAQSLVSGVPKAIEFLHARNVPYRLGVLVRTAKFRPEQLENPSVRPDRILDSLADLAELF
jgi:hypothetical protein